MTDGSLHRFTVDAERAGERLDTFLASQPLPFTRSQLKRRIDAGEVTVNGEAAKPSRKLRTGDEVAFAPPPPEPSDLVPEDLPLRVLFEDAYLIAIDKPAGMVVHPAAGNRRGTLVNALLAHCKDLSGIGGELRPGIVHRLDKDTTGVLVATKDDETHAAMGALFKKRDLTRLYQAIVSPPPEAEGGVIKTLYGRHPTRRKRFSSRVSFGKTAITNWKVLERFGDRAALIQCKLETGRTHQIRVHLADLGHGIVGDQTYGKPPPDLRVREIGEQLGRQALHAATLRFVHPRTGQVIDLATEPPEDFTAAVAALRK